MMQFWLSVLERSDRMLSIVHSELLDMALQREVTAKMDTRHNSNINNIFIVLLLLDLIFIVCIILSFHVIPKERKDVL